MIKEKQHRLSFNIYEGFVTVSFTICIKDRVSIFTSADIVNLFGEALVAEAASFDCDVPIYLFMPDHLHVILKGTSDTAHPLKAINQFKQKTGYWLSKNDAHVQWQKGYYDHIIRMEEDLTKHIRYVLDNPIREGIVANWIDYPFKGSATLNLDSEPF